MGPKRKAAKEKSSELSSDEIKRLLEWIDEANSTTGGVLCSEVKKFLENQQEDASQECDVKLILKNLLEKEQLVKVGYRYFTQVASTLRKNRVKKLAPTVGKMGPKKKSSKEKGSETNSAENKRLLERPTAQPKNGVQKLAPTVGKRVVNNCPKQAQKVLKSVSPVEKKVPSNALDIRPDPSIDKSKWDETHCKYCATSYRCKCYIELEKKKEKKWDGTRCEVCRTCYRCNCYLKMSYEKKNIRTQTDMPDGADNAVLQRMMSIYS